MATTFSPQSASSLPPSDPAAGPGAASPVNRLRLDSSYQPPPAGLSGSAHLSDAERPTSHPGNPGDAVDGAVSLVNREEESLPAIPPQLARLPVGLMVSVPVRQFRVRHLLAIAPGGVIESQWGLGEDLPLSSGDVQLAWSEFEVVDTRLAVRVTRLA
jgi:flagellar motor switch/type III secretory pathway protein FliN